MKVDTQVTGNNGMGLFGIIFIVFLILKLTNLISWSWVWVLAPLWIGFALFAVTLIVVMIWWELDKRKSR